MIEEEINVNDYQVILEKNKEMGVYQVPHAQLVGGGGKSISNYSGYALCGTKDRNVKFQKQKSLEAMQGFGDQAPVHFIQLIRLDRKKVEIRENQGTKLGILTGSKNFTINFYSAEERKLWHDRAQALLGSKLSFREKSQALVGTPTNQIRQLQPFEEKLSDKDNSNEQKIKSLTYYLRLKKDIIENLLRTQGGVMDTTLALSEFSQMCAQIEKSLNSLNQEELRTRPMNAHFREFHSRTSHDISQTMPKFDTYSFKSSMQYQSCFDGRYSHRVRPSEHFQDAPDDSENESDQDPIYDIDLKSFKDCCDTSQISAIMTTKPEKVEVRDQLPYLKPPNQKVSIWKVIKNSIGKDLTKLAVPVHFNEPLSMLQKIAEMMEHHNLLEMAAAEEDASLRMIYVQTFMIAMYANTNGRLTKPFNPILGETFEIKTPDFSFVSE